MSASAESTASPRIAALVAFLVHRRAVVLLVATGLALVAAYRTVLTYGALRSDLEELLPQTAPSVGALHTLRERLPGLRHLGVVVDVGRPEHAAAAVRFIDELKTRVDRYPKDLVRETRAGIAAERRFAETYALQWMDPDDLRKLRKAVEARRDWRVSREMGIDLLNEEEDPPPPLPIEELRNKYRARYGNFDASSDGRFVSKDRKTAVLLIQAASHRTGYESDHELLSRVQEDIDALGFPGAYAAGMRVGYAGDIATRVEEMDGLAADLTFSGALVLACIVLLIVWFYGTFWALPILGVPLVFGTLYTFLVAALPPLSIRHLNSNTAFLGSIVIGNGINTGIILLSRFQEERRRGQSLEPALVAAVTATWRPTLAAALAASAAYGSLVVTDFRGFNQFGWIGGVGMLTCWLAMQLLVAPLVAYMGKRLGAPRRGHGPGLTERLARAVLNAPRAVIAGTLFLSAASGFAVSSRSSDWMEHDFSKLRRRDSWVNGERYWGQRMDATLGRYLTPTVVLCDTPEQARTVAARLREVKERERAGDLIAEVRSLRDALPEARAESAREIERLSAVLTPRLLSELDADERRLVERATSPRAATPLSAADLPDALVAGLRENDGRIDRVVLVFPKLTPGTWDAPRISEFSRDLREAANMNGRALPVAGSLLLSNDIADAMRADGPRATTLALSMVLLVCWFAFGFWRRTQPGSAPYRAERRGAAPGALMLSSLAVGSVFVGVLVMLGALATSGARLNFSNFVALPITFGIGADYSINVLRRYQSDASLDASRALAATGGAVALCSATTIIGFGSLLVAQNQALFSFGVFAVAGELACLMTAVVSLPAALTLLSRRSAKRSGAV
ncbi:MAG TPA: MMPL family transporter [Polyangiaceae bacterium]